MKLQIFKKGAGNVGEIEPRIGMQTNRGLITKVTPAGVTVTDSSGAEKRFLFKNNPELNVTLASARQHGFKLPKAVAPVAQVEFAD